MAKITLSSQRNGLILLFLMLTALGFAQSQTYNADGNFTVPAGVTSVTVEGWGGGGRGGSRSTDGRGGGGGGAAYARKVITVTPGATYSVNVGAGSTSSSSGEDSWFINNTTFLAKGGSSVATNTSAGASGGLASACIADVAYNGGSGADGGTNGGGGGASASSTAIGVDATNGNGATATGDGGNGGNGRFSSNGQGSGSVGQIPGGGGGGAYRTSGSTKDGGAGARGRVIISWSIQEINITGNGVTIVDGDNAPTIADHTNFGSADILTGTVTRTFTIQNTGTAPLAIGAITISGANAADFTIGTFPSATVAAGSSTTFTVIYDPSTLGTSYAAISIVNDDISEDPYNFAIQGTCTTPEIALSGNGANIVNNDMVPTTTNWTDFGGTNHIGSTLTRTFTITNVTGASGVLNIGAITISGVNASDFTITTAPAASVAVGSSTTFVVTFDPSAVGVRTATISIVNDDANENPFVFAIQGTGYRNEINILGGGFTISDGTTTTSLSNHTDFGTTDITSGTITRTFTITNDVSATGPITIGAITFSGTNAGDFTITAAPASSIDPGMSTTFDVTFNPSANGVRSATINIVNNDANENPYNFNLVGTGSEPEIDILGNGSSIVDGDATPAFSDHTNFNNAEITSGTVTRTFTITNAVSAGMPLTIGAITFSGTNAADFAATTPTSTVINPGQSATFTVVFNPSATGTRNATINIVNNDSNENPYNFAISGTGTSPEISVVGNSVTIADGDVTPSVADQTDFGTVSIDSGSSVVTYTIRNTGVGTMLVGAISFSGSDASSFSLVTNPAGTIAAGGSTTFTVSFNPATVGTKNAMIFIANDDADENPYNFSITGLGVRTYPDTDGDGITDNIDIDDDNDGIIDTAEEANCITYPLANSLEHIFLNETFGAGATRAYINVNVPGATCNYCFEDGVASPNTPGCPSQTSWILDDGEYTVVHKIASNVASDPENIHGDLAWNGLEDHTPGDTNGRMAVFNASFSPGTFYETTIGGTLPNVPITYSFWVLNIMSTHNYAGSILPNITVEFLDLSNNVLATYNTGNIGRCNGGTGVNTCAQSQWQQYSTTVNLGNTTQFIIRFKNNAPGGGGNDLAIDDILIRQQYCDRDGDGVANIYDLDADNDGIPDIEEAGFRSYTAGRAIMDLSTSVWMDVNANGLHDAIDAMIAGGTYVMPDSDSDGVADFVDLDSDNDGLFDVDEAGLLNGDGDVDGDGVGDGLDTDLDGMLNVFDTFVGWGTQVRPFAANTDGAGACDYQQTDSNNDGITDISTTLYNNLDTNNDGIIDGAADVDKDGIRDAFDTSTTYLGSPRDLNRKLFVELDGRNDYADSRQLLSGLPAATIMGWIKINVNLASQGVIMGQDNFNMRITTTSGKRLQVTANGVSITYTTQLQPDRWYHVAAVYDGSLSTERLKLYLNGQQVQQSSNAALAGSLAASTAKFTMGKTSTTNTNYFYGSIEEVRVFNAALSADQLQKMVYQEIKQNGSAVRGEIIPKDIETSSWASLLAYYRMDTFKDDVIDDMTTAAIDAGSASTLARIYNVKNIRYQLAPMPFVTTLPGALETSVSQSNFVHGMDVFTYDWSIVHYKHHIKIPNNNVDLGSIIDPGVDLVMTNDNVMRNTWYMKLDGMIDLENRAQLVQTATSDLDPTSSGYIERDQQGQTNRYNYNYWSSPVGGVNATSNNNAFTVASVMKDGTNPANPMDIQWTTGINSSATTPITLSGYWIFKFQNVNNDYANWSNVGPNGSLLPGQGFTLKGSNALTPTQNYVFVGKPNNGTITSPIAAGNLNLSGNPYASAIDADAFITDNLASTTGALYFWEHFSTNSTHALQDYQGGYSVRTLVGGTPPVAPAGVSGNGSSTRIPGRFIPVGQGFFVSGSNTGGTITFNNAQRAFIREDNVDSNVMFRAAGAPEVSALPSDELLNNNEDVVDEGTAYRKIRLGFIAPNNYHRQVLLGFMDDKATSGYDRGYDALHIDGQPNDMYFMLGTAKLNIQGDSYFNEQNVYPLGIKTNAEGNVQFVLDDMENFEDGQHVYIHDNVTGIYHEITDEAAVIAVGSGIADDRFTLTFIENGGQLGVQNPDQPKDVFIAYASNEDIINIKNNHMEITVKDVLLFNMLGQSVAKWNVENENQTDIRIPANNLSAGTYIVKLVTSNGEITKKIVIK